VRATILVSSIFLIPYRSQEVPITAQAVSVARRSEKQSIEFLSR